MHFNFALNKPEVLGGQSPPAPPGGNLQGHQLLLPSHCDLPEHKVDNIQVYYSGPVSGLIRLGIKAYNKQ